MKITMDGEYAFKNGPTEKVRILCVDAGGDRPVLVLNNYGCVLRRQLTGAGSIRDQPLIPLQRTPRDFWVNVYPNFSTVYEVEDDAKNRHTSPNETIHVREVLE